MRKRCNSLNMMKTKYDQLTAGAQALLNEQTAIMNRIGDKRWAQYTEAEQQEIREIGRKINKGFTVDGFVAVPTLNLGRTSSGSHMSLRFYEIKENGWRTNSSKAKAVAALGA